MSIQLKDLRYYEDGIPFETFCRHAFGHNDRYGDFSALIFAEQRGNKKGIAEHLPDVKALMHKAIAAYLQKPFSDDDKATWRAMDKAVDDADGAAALFPLFKQGWDLYLPIKPPLV